MAGRLLVRIAGVAGLGLAYALQRRRLRRAIVEDPEWSQVRTPLASRPVEVTSADGTRLHAEVFGQDGDPTIVLVHGWCCSVRFWHYQLRDLVDDYRVVAYDLRGHGRSEVPATGDYSTDALAADLHAVLARCVPVEERTIVAGHSMGGMSLVAWAGAHPEEVDRRLAAVVLVDTGMGRLIARSRIGPTISALAVVRTAIGRLLLSIPLPVPAPPDPVALGAVRYIALGPNARPAHVAFCTQMVVDCRPRVRAGFGVTLARLDLVDSLPRLVVPTVVLVGGDDVLTTVEQARVIAEKVPGAELFELPSRGHMAPVEGHEEVTRHIRAIAERTLFGAKQPGSGAHRPVT